MIKKLFIGATAALSLLGTEPLFANSADDIRTYIGSALPELPSCSRERASIEYTMEVLSWYSFPETGKFVLVNIPSGTLSAYEDGHLVMEMRIIVGKPGHQTPTQSTNITEVRLNPTWTVPQSIIRADGWKDRLNDDPDFFVRNNFKFRDQEGNLLSMEEAQSNPDLVARFVQDPGRNNALGEYRFNIQSGSAIYLHDTRDREAFRDGSPLALSHGCVRIENPKKFALWLLEMAPEDLDDLRGDGRTKDIKLDDPVPILMEYFTAWPSADGEILIYDDIYGFEGGYCSSYQDW